MGDDFNIEGESVDSSALQRELARRVEARRASGAYSPEVESLLAERLPDEEEFGKLPAIAELDYAATRAMSSWEVSAAYPIDTEKGGPLRPMVLFAKRFARLWARIAVGPIQVNQTAFNRHAAVGLESLRRQAVAERTEALAAEKDLAELAGAMLAEGEAPAMAQVLSGFVGETKRLTVVGPAPAPLLKALQAKGIDVLSVSAGTAWDESAGDSVSMQTAPLSFLGQLDEASQTAMLVSELSFWMKPEALISLARRAYLVLAPRGKIAVTVAGFASAGPAPAWCSGPVVKKVLSMAGFLDIAVERPGDEGSFVATARKP